MDHFRSVDQNAFVVAFEEMRGLVSDRRGSLHCPKPRRFGAFSDNLLTRSRQPEAFDSKARKELLDLILMKEDIEMERPATPAAFFSGSPPSRSHNPLIQDPRFRDERINPIMAVTTNASPSGLPSPSSSAAARKGCARIKFGLKPAAVRVEGFDCLNRDGQNSSIPAMA